MDWIRVDAGMPSHPKIGRIARELGIDRMEAVGIVVSLWCWTSISRESGILNGLEPPDLAYACLWSGDPEKIVSALTNAGLLDNCDGVLSIHEWIDKQGRYERVRRLNARRQESYRDSNGIRCGSVTTDRTDETDRTDQTDETKKKSCPKSEEPTLLLFPVEGGKAKTWAFTETFAEQLNQAFPHLVIDDEARKALAWCIANPSRRKTPRGMPRFLNQWMATAQDKGEGRKR